VSAIVGAIAAGGVSVGTNAPVRIEEIRSAVTNGRTAVVIAASEPVAYITSRPDPFTVLVDLRNASADGLRNELQAGGPSPVAGVEVETASAPDGSGLVRIKVSLLAPVAHHVESARGVIWIELDRERPAAASAASAVSATSATPAPSTVPTAPPITTVPRPDDAAKPPTSVPPATTIRAIRTSAGSDEVRVTISANGALSPGRIAEAADPPPRLVLDFPELRANVPALTTVNLGPLRQIRVAPHSHEPLVTRIVFDLRRPTRYRVEQATGESRDLTIVFPIETAVARIADPILDVFPVEPAQPEEIPEETPEDTSVPPAATEPDAPEVQEIREPVLVAAPTPASLDPVVARALASSAAVAQAGPLAGLPTADTGQTVDVAPQVEVPVEAIDLSPLSLFDLPITVVEQVPVAPRLPPATPAPVPSPIPQVAAPQVIGGLGSGQVTEFTGDPVSLDFQNADLRAVLRAFAGISSLNIVIDPNVQGSVDVALRDVPWDQAFDIILRANALGYTVDGTIVRIAPLTVLFDEEAQRRALADELALSGELVVVPRILSYARAADLAELITTSVLSQRGQVQIDERTNTLIITDLAANVGNAADLINTLDRAEPQVEIEARIVQTTSDFAKELGVQWGLNGRLAPELGNTTGLSFPNRAGLTGRTGGTQGPVGFDARAIDTENSGTAVNLPVNAPTGAVGLTLGAINGAFNLDVALSALESSGNGRILSTPRVTTQNNVQAEVKQGIQIPIQTVANNTVTVSFKDAALSLRVTPQITQADTVIMQIILENASPDFSRSINGIPPIDTQFATTQVQVDNGDTTVIGGIFLATELESSDRVPYLSRIPLLGWLFRRELNQTENRELLIFITPRIIR
jgi:type IV pilus assembly protein PilQ